MRAPVSCMEKFGNAPAVSVIWRLWNENTSKSFPVKHKSRQLRNSSTCSKAVLDLEDLNGKDHGKHLHFFLFVSNPGFSRHSLYSGTFDSEFWKSLAGKRAHFPFFCSSVPKCPLPFLLGFNFKASMFLPGLRGWAESPDAVIRSGGFFFLFMMCRTRLGGCSRFPVSSPFSFPLLTNGFPIIPQQI